MLFFYCREEDCKESKNDSVSAVICKASSRIESRKRSRSSLERSVDWGRKVGLVADADECNESASVVKEDKEVLVHALMLYQVMLMGTEKQTSESFLSMCL